MNRLVCLVTFLLIGCGTTAPRSAAPPDLTAAESVSHVRVRAALPAGMGSSGNVIALAYTPAEVAAGMPGSPASFMDTLRRAQVARGVRAVEGMVELDVVGPARPFTVTLVFDTADQGLEALFGARPGVASGQVQVPAVGDPPVVDLEGSPFEERAEDCAGKRRELLRLDAPETRREGDDGVRLLCVQLPPSYGVDAERRYPVVLVFPGFSGWHANSNGWRARRILEREGAARGLEAIVVGVGTRTAEGTSYLDSSARFGDWDRYLTDRVLPALDQRYRTVPVRAAYGHSTGGWNAMAFATRHPDLVGVVASSSPDALDLDAWMLGPDGAIRREWLWWMRVEHDLGGPGQFTSYAAAWSPDESAPRGLAWPVDFRTGALLPAVYARWQGRSPAAALSTEDGLRNARRLSGNVAVTVGRADEFGLYAPAERYVAALVQAGVEVRWLPTELGHFGADEERWTPLLRFVVDRLAAALDPPR